MTPKERALALARKIPHCEGVEARELMPLVGVISLNNQVFRLTHGGDDYFLRIASEKAEPFGIRRPEEMAAMKAAVAHGIAPPLVYEDPEGHFACRFIKGRHWNQEDFSQSENVQRLGEFLKTLHGVDFQKGVSIFSRIERMAAYALAKKFWLPPDMGPKLETCAQIFEETGDGVLTLSHHDLWANNFIDDGKRLWAIDWEFSGRGNGLHDLNTLLMASGYQGGLRRDFLSACGRDPLWVEAQLAKYQYVVHMFEGTWAAVMHGLRGSDEHGYAGMAKSHFDRLRHF